MRVVPTIGIGRVLKSRKLTVRFIGPYQILKRIGPVAYRIALPPLLSNLHNVFHVTQLRKYVGDPSHEVESDQIELKDKLTFATLPVKILDTSIKRLRGKEIALVKVLWIQVDEGDATWEVERDMREDYPHLFKSRYVQFSGTKILIRGGGL
ncbi:hypothetical protein Lalb_Chr12g0207381 [Lupinus albus]|uniref:Tf2-1-like SH3-like domain-containing protein n=1 Tax=Lupinus albus TaxID=3870 RepID=A0A6A4PNL9_LUPAL|nr:hypothetical protein Lalb_Chr12g0207381 [Lupinus albus]